MHGNALNFLKIQLKTLQIVLRDIRISLAYFKDKVTILHEMWQEQLECWGINSAYEFSVYV